LWRENRETDGGAESEIRTPLFGEAILVGTAQRPSPCAAGRLPTFVR